MKETLETALAAFEKQRSRRIADYNPSTFIKGDGSDLLALPKKIKRIEVLGNATFLERARPVLGKRFELVLRAPSSGLITGNKQ